MEEARKEANDVSMSAAAEELKQLLGRQLRNLTLQPFKRWRRCGAKKRTRGLRRRSTQKAHRGNATASLAQQSSTLNQEEKSVMPHKAAKGL